MELVKKNVFVKRRGIAGNVPKEVEPLVRNTWSPVCYQNTNIPATGLEQYEKDAILPEIISMPSSHNDFNLKVNEYYNNLGVDIPSGKGLVLNVSTSYIKEVSGFDAEGKAIKLKVAMPVVPRDYIIYKAMLADTTEVAKDKAKFDQDTTLQYYIHDQAIEKAIQNTIARERDKAYGIYLDIKDEPNVVDAILQVYGKDISRMDAIDKEDALREIAQASKINVTDKSKLEEHFKRFVLVSGDKDIATRVLISLAVKHKIIHTNTGSYLYMKDDLSVPMGNSEAEAIAFLKNGKNSQTRVMIEAQLQNNK